MATAELKGHVVLFRMKSDRFCELPLSETVKLELLNGKVFARPWPTPFYQYFVFQLGAVVEQWAGAHKLGAVLPDTLMKLDEDWTPAPDFVFVARKHWHRVKERQIEGPVDLAVEVLSPEDEDLDREIKFGAYGKFGIPWYWIVDLQKRVLEEYKRLGRSYGSLVKVSFDEPFEPRLFPGLVIDLASLEW